MEIKYVPLKLLVKKVKVGFVGSIDSFYCQKNDGYPLLRTLNLTGTGIDYSDLKYVTKEFFDKNKKSQLHKGDILIARHGDNGKADIFNESFEAQALNVVIIEPDNTKASSNLIKYYFDMPFVKKQIENLTNGSVQGVINTEQIADLKIPIIETLNYNKTINILMNIDNQIKRNNDMVQKLQVLGNTIYSNNALNQKDTFNISNVATPIWGVCPSGEHILDANTNNTIKYASGAGDIDDNLISLNPKGYTDLPSKKVNKKDICISVAGTVGKIGIANEEIAIGRAMLGFSNKELYGYLYFGLSFYSETLKKKSTGAIQKIINTSHIEVINLPKYTNQVATQLNNIVDMILNIETQTLQLNQLKQTLLPLLINGQLVV